MRVVLAVAGEPAVRETLRSALNQDDLVLIEGTMAGAMRRLAALQVDAIVVEDRVDLGLSAVPELRSLAPHVPLALLTPREDTLFRQRAQDAGADTCLPQSPSAQAIERFLQVSAAAEPLQSRIAPREEANPMADVLRAHEQIVQWLVLMAGQRWDLPVLAQETVRVVAHAFGAMRCAFVWGEGEAGRVAASIGYAPAVVDELQFSFSHGLLFQLNQHAALLAAGDELLTPQTQRELRLLHGQLGVPLLRDGQVMGVLVLAEKGTGGGYRAPEKNLLLLLARCLPMLIADPAAGDRQNRPQEAGLDRLISRLASGLVTVGHDRNVHMVNPSAERILGRTAEELVGRDVAELGSAFARVAAAALADGAPRLRQVIQDPLYRGPIGLTASPLNGDGVAVLFSSLPLAVAEPAADETPFWQYLASRLAQEIKNPMVAVNTYAQLLPHKFSSIEFRESFASTVQSEIGRINRVVEILFAYAEEPQLDARPVNFAALAAAIIEEHETDWAQQGVTVSRSIDDSLPKLQADPYFLQRACEHLFQNSVESMPRGGSMEIQIRSASHQVELEVRNSGLAIPDEDLRRLFLPFFSTKERGMGLGLPLARRYAEAHGGSLFIQDNQPGRVSFVLRLPYSGDSNADPLDYR
jgi:nitrogen-specific signal transduction histidine kinase